MFFFGALEANRSPGPPEGPWRPLKAPWSPLEAPAGPWSPLKRPGTVWKPSLHGFGVLGTLDWDLRWIMTRALLRDTRSFSYRFVARSQNTFRLLVKCLDTRRFSGSECHVLVDTRRFSGSECHTLNTILNLRQLTLGSGKLVNRCFADLEVYMPNDHS